jgi:hypothetical protein
MDDPKKTQKNPFFDGARARNVSTSVWVLIDEKLKMHIIFLKYYFATRQSLSDHFQPIILLPPARRE